MVKVEAIQEAKQDSANFTSISLFSIGSEIITLKIFSRIARDPKRLWRIADFSDLASDIVIKRRLKELARKGVIVRLRTYPVFFKLKS